MHAVCHTYQRLDSIPSIFHQKPRFDDIIYCCCCRVLSLCSSSSMSSSSSSSSSDAADKQAQTAAVQDAKFHLTCEKTIEKVLLRNPKVHKLLDAIENLGCPLPKNFFACRPCEAQQISGGIMIDNAEGQAATPKIVICEDKLVEIETFENTLVHELVHAYDICRAKIDFTNCVQHACTEIRASSLSGECGILHEAFRGHLKLHGGHHDCVKRRATLSVENNPVCKEIAAKAVEAAFAKCYEDYSPFEK